MSPFLSNLLFQAANFMVLAVVLAWLFTRPIRRAIDERRAKLTNELDEIERKKSEAAQAVAVADERVKQLGIQLSAMETRSKDAAKRERLRMIDEARAQIDREREAFVDEQESIRRAMLIDQADAIASSTAAGVRELLAEIDGPELEALLFHACLLRLKDVPVERLTAITVESAGALGSDELAEIEAIIGGSNAAYRVDPKLIAGVRLRGPFGVIDASVAGLSTFAERELRPRWRTEMLQDGDKRQRQAPVKVA